MTATLRFLATFSVLLFAIGLRAQPELDGHFGCHISRHPIELPKNTGATEKLLPCDNSRSDSLDILNYDLEVDLTLFGSLVKGVCTITFTAKEDGIEALPLDLLRLDIDSVTIAGSKVQYDYNDTLLHVHLPTPINIGDTMDVTVTYHGLPTPDPQWGGFRYEDGIGYNLGIGLGQRATDQPFPIGRSLYPCFDNFVERATYDISVVTSGGRKGYAIGEFLGEDSIANNAIRRSYRMDKQNPTYLTCIAASNYVETHGMYSGPYGDYPILLVSRPNEQANMVSAFEYLPNAIETMEKWFGPYAYDQVGYVITPNGAMEHSTLISYPDFSIVSGPTAGMNGLMAHELAHHWWGNISNQSCPENMWIKEGNAEYCSHLFVEHTFGREEFLKVVESNHFDVINNAHKQDGGIYHPLSGIPKFYTYGKHTYDKGASMMHNLRNYLGDSLFSQAMTSVLDTYRFSAIDAQQMQEQLTANSGIDMSHFFQNWLYQGGYANYEFESVEYEQNGNTWDANISIQQKLHHATYLHTNTPLEISFFDKDFSIYKAIVMVSGEMSDVTVSGIPFEPAHEVINDEQFLNLGRLQDRIIVKGTGDATFNYVGISNFEITEFPNGDSALLTAVHHLTAPDNEPTLPELVFSNTHFWQLDGVIPSGTKMKAWMFYTGNNEFDLDYDLLQNGTDELILVWRPNPQTPWGEYPYYSRQALGTTLGRFKIDDMLPGEYAFAFGEAPMATSASELRNDLAIKVFPNPVAERLNVQAILPNSQNVPVTLYDALGKRVLQNTFTAIGNELNGQLNISHLPAGVYALEVVSEDGSFRTVEQFVKE